MKRLFFIFILLTFLGLILFSLFQINSVGGSFMEPSLKSGQTLIFRKLGANNPKRGDVVLYRPKSSSTTNYDMDYIGRVVGLPTESVRIENGNLYIDNNVTKYKVSEEYLLADTKTIGQEEGKWTKIGEFEYLILTDDRSKSISIPNRLVHRDSIIGILFWKL